MAEPTFTMDMPVTAEQIDARKARLYKFAAEWVCYIHTGLYGPRDTAECIVYAASVSYLETGTSSQEEYIQ